MKSSPFVRNCVLAVVVIVSCIGAAWADGPYSEEAATSYGIESELLVHMVNTGGVVYHTLSTIGGSTYMEYRRPSWTPAWSVDGDSDELSSYYRVIPQEGLDAYGKICCEFTCIHGAGGLNTTTQQCTAEGSNCTICYQTCTTGNAICPRTGKYLQPIGE